MLGEVKPRPTPPGHTFSETCPYQKVGDHPTARERPILGSSAAMATDSPEYELQARRPRSSPPRPRQGVSSTTLEPDDSEDDPRGSAATPSRRATASNQPTHSGPRPNHIRFATTIPSAATSLPFRQCYRGRSCDPPGKNWRDWPLATWQCSKKAQPAPAAASA